MFQQRNQRRRFESSQNNFRRQSRKDSGVCVGEGIAAQIVDFDPPAFERGRHAACQRTVRCYQRDGFVGFRLSRGGKRRSKVLPLRDWQPR